MPQCHFTDATVNKLKPPKTRAQIDYFEALPPGRSLILTVGASRRTWSVLFYVRSKPKRRKLGYVGYADAEYPSLTCKQAREAVRAFDVREAMKPKAGSFRQVAENWFERHARKLRSRSELRRHLDSIILPAWGDLPFAEIRRGDANALLDKIEDGRGANQADAVLATVRAIMNWHQSRDENYTSPIVKGMRRSKPVQRERVLDDDDEIRAVWNGATDLGGNFGALVKLCLLTAQRKTKVASMKWADIDFDSGVWTIASEPREKGNPGSLRLPQAALDIIAAQPVLADNPFVFASSRSRNKKYGHFNSWSQGKRQLDQLAPMLPPWIVHDLRRTARSLLSRIGVNSHTAERVMGHVIAGVEGVYDRHRYEPEMADALRRLAAEIARILDPGAKIVALRG